MIIDVEKIKDLLADETVSAYEIEKYSDLNRTTITNLRNGDADLMRLGLGSALKLMNYIETEESKMMITKYELRMATIEAKKNEIHEGCTQEQGDIMSEIIKEFDNLEDAKAALENYESKVEYLGRGKYYVTEYYVEVNDYEVIDGEEYIEPVGEAYFAKGNYNI